MKRFRRGLASLLAAVLLVSVLPTAALAQGETPPAPAAEVTYNLLDRPVTVGTDPVRAGEDPYGYRLFSEDGSYTIQVENDAFFPYEVQFTHGENTWSEWFLTPEDTVTVGGHVFSIQSDATDGAEVLTGLSLQVSGETVTVYPEAKTFTDRPRPAFRSLLPLTEHDLGTVPLTGFLRNELTAVGLEALLGEHATDGAAAVMWAKRSDSPDDAFTIVTPDSKLDLVAMAGKSEIVSLEIIVGTADQLEPDNIRYILTARLPSGDDQVTPEAFTTDGSPIDLFDYSFRFDGNSNYAYSFDLNVDPAVYTGGQAKVRLKFADSIDTTNLTATVYAGFYPSEEEALADGANDITSQIWGPAAPGYQADYSLNNDNAPTSDDAVFITMIFRRAGTIVQVMPGFLRMNPERARPSLNYLLSVNEGTYADAYSRHNWDSSSDAEVETVTLKRGLSASDPYRATFSVYNPDPDSTLTDADLVEKAVVGLYDSLSAAAAQPDIKDVLFGDGYSAVYGGKGVDFTFFMKDGTYVRLRVKAVEQQAETLPDAPKPGREDTYFSVTGARYRDRHGNDISGYYDLESCVMPYDADGYYYGYAESDVNFGYQTVFLLDSDGTAVNDGEVMVPSFNAGTGVKVYASVAQGQSAVEQTSDVSELTFESGKVIPYSARSESSTAALKNYWVTFVTQQPGAKLFVNAANDTARYDEDENIPVREIYLDDAHGNHHDVFFANIGDTALTGLSVELVDPVNVALDDYWTINAGGKRSLAAFTTVEKTATNGELPNMAKLRLVPAEGSSGEVSGTLVIKADMGTPDTNDDQEVRIKLTGYTGAMGITTTSIVDGVRYVPYSSVIQTNAMGSSSAVTFSLEAGTLPNGVVLRSNGELYGVPTVTGSFPITVKAVSNSDPTLSDTASFTLNVLPNTDANVASSIDTGYEFVTDSAGDGRVPATLTAYSDYVFHSNGAYGEFQAFWLDGQKLVDGRDYDSEEGSTKITIRAQTFRAAGEGMHTIAAEFRQGGSATGALKRTAQNYTSTVPDSSSDDDDDDRNSSPATPVKPATPADTSVRGFLDVQPSDWCAADVAWAYDNGYMKGFSATRFSPNSPITPVTAVVILARLSGADLDAYTDASNANVPAGQWYTPHAVWAREAGILPARDFVAGRPSPRGELAVMLVNYLKSMGIDCTVPDPRVDFADAAEMTQEENDAFQVLYAFGIFKGKGNYVMDPTGSTTRAQMAALTHRLSAFVAERG